MSVQMPKQPFALTGSGQLPPAWHKYFEQIQRFSETLDANQTALNLINTTIDSLGTDVDGLPTFGTLASVNHVALTQAEYDAIATPDENTLYLIEEA